MNNLNNYQGESTINNFCAMSTDKQISSDSALSLPNSSDNPKSQRRPKIEVIIGTGIRLYYQKPNVCGGGTDYVVLTKPITHWISEGFGIEIDRGRGHYYYVVTNFHQHSYKIPPFDSDRTSNLTLPVGTRIIMSNGLMHDLIDPLDVTISTGGTIKLLASTKLQPMCNEYPGITLEEDRDVRFLYFDYSPHIAKLY